jgi:hypothetical protein
MRPPQRRRRGRFGPLPGVAVCAGVCCRARQLSAVQLSTRACNAPARKDPADGGMRCAMCGMRVAVRGVCGKGSREGVA